MPPSRLKQGMRFIHTADWQLGKPFGRFDIDVRAALTEARFEALDAIGKAAAENGAGHVLVAGDVFDTEGPEDRTIIQAISRMARHGCRWWLLPGNHDYARNGGLWDRVIGKAAPNITVLRDPTPVEIESGTWILPAPLTHRHNLDDPTSAFDAMATPGAKLRIGLAHGSIRDFGSRGEANNQIAPDRARLSSLAYLALGDWHGTLEVDSRTWYAGTPETDRFQRDAPGQILLVDIEAGGAPAVTPLRTGRFQWLKRDWRINDFAAFEAERQTLWSEIEPSATLLQLSVAGVASLSERIRVLEILEADIGHQLRYLEARTDDLVAQPTEEDMLVLAVEGVLGSAAQKLNALRESGAADAGIARRALERLFVEFARGEAA
jgi:hypothetical protein